MKTCTQVTNCVYIPPPPPQKKTRGKELKQMENYWCLKPCLEKRATGEALQMYGVLVKADIDTGRKRRRIWLRHRATSRKVTGPIPNGVTGIHWRNPSGRTVAQVPTQKWVPGIFSWVYRQSMRRAVSLTTFMCRLCWNLGVVTSGSPQGISKPVQWFLFYDVDTQCLHWNPSLLHNSRKCITPKMPTQNHFR